MIHISAECYRRPLSQLLEFRTKNIFVTSLEGYRHVPERLGNTVFHNIFKYELLELSHSYSCSRISDKTCPHKAPSDTLVHEKESLFITMHQQILAEKITQQSSTKVPRSYHQNIFRFTISCSRITDKRVEFRISNYISPHSINSRVLVHFQNVLFPRKTHTETKKATLLDRALCTMIFISLLSKIDFSLVVFRLFSVPQLKSHSFPEPFVQKLKSLKLVTVLLVRLSEKKVFYRTLSKTSYKPAPVPFFRNTDI